MSGDVKHISFLRGKMPMWKKMGRSWGAGKVIRPQHDPHAQWHREEDVGWEFPRWPCGLVFLEYYRRRQTLWRTNALMVCCVINSSFFPLSALTYPLVGSSQERDWLSSILSASPLPEAISTILCAYSTAHVWQGSEDACVNRVL